jgi:hypothetical protein
MGRRLRGVSCGPFCGRGDGADGFERGGGETLDRC